MKRGKGWVGSWLLRLAVLLVAAGSVAAAYYAQSLVTPNISALARPALIYVGAALVFAAVFRLPPAARLDQPRRSEHTAIRGMVVFVALAVLGLSWWQASLHPTGFLSLFLWLASIGLLLAGMANWPRRFSLAHPVGANGRSPRRWRQFADRCRERVLQKRTLVAAVPLALVMIVALGVRLYRLEELPAFFIDESIGGFYALKASLKGSLPLFTPVWEGASNVPFVLEGFAYAWFGQSLTALRLPYAVVGALEVFFVYLLGKEIAGKKAGLVAALLLAVLEVHVHFSRTTMFTSTSIAWTGAAAFLARGVRRGSWFEWVLAGAIVGLGLNTGFSARLLPIVVALFLAGLLILRPRPLRWLLPGILFIALGLVVGTGPFMAHFVAHPDQYLARTGESWLGPALAGLTNPSSVANQTKTTDLLWQNLQRQTLGINLFGDAHTWYREGRPMLGPLLSPLFFLAVAALTVRLRDWRCLAWGVWLWATFILLGVASNMTPVFHRPMPFLAMACLAIGVGVGGVGSLVKTVFKQRPAQWVYWLAAGVLVGTFAVQQLSDYFLNYAPRDNWPTDDLLARYLHDLGPGNDVVMLGDFDHGTQSRLVQFATRLGKKNAAIDWKDAKTPVRSPQAGRSLVFVAHQSRLKDLATVKGLYPGGREAELKALGKTWWTVYKYGSSR